MTPPTFNALNSAVATWRVAQLVLDGHLGHSQLEGHHHDITSDFSFDEV